MTSRRPRFAAIGAALIVVAVVLLAGCKAKTTFPDAPVILISIDTLRADHLSIYGANKVDTPAIDRLAGDGIVFENAYSQVPLTLPSHASMLTGMLPYQNGVRSNVGYRLDGNAHPSIPRLLKEHGYATGGAVSAWVLRRDTGLGPLFDFYDDSMEVSEKATLGALQRRGGETARVAMAWLDTIKGEPAFLFLHLFEPHSPYEPVEPFRTKYKDSPYDGEIATADAIMGRFLEGLVQRGIYDRALIILAGDHGEGLGDHGEAEHGVLLYREELHVPLIVKLPGNSMSGRRVAAPAALIDILPTITHAVGAKTPADVAGVSLLDLAQGKAPANRAIYSETLYPRLHLGWSQLRSLTDPQDHYIESPAPELFDQTVDPAEKKNIRDAHRREANTLADRLTAIPLNLQVQQAATPEEVARLSALGYLSGAAQHMTGPLLNPRDHIQVLLRIQHTFELDQQRRYRESVDECRAILRDYPDLVDVYTQLAGNLRRLGRLQESLDAYHEGVRRSPQLVDALAIEIAKLELDLGNLKAAELNARLAMKLDPQDAHLVLAGIAEAKSDWVTAERESRLAIGREERPRLPALVHLARALAEQKRLDEALAAIDRAVARVSRDGAEPIPTIASTRGDILARMGRNGEAEAAFRQEMKMFPQTSDAFVKLAILLASEHRFSEIAPTLDAMVTASPLPATYMLAARAMSDLGNEPAARLYRQKGKRLAAEMLRQRSTR